MSAQSQSASELQDVVVALRKRVKRLHRRVLEPKVLKGLLRNRLQAMHHAGTTPERQARENRLLAASPAYASNVADQEPPVDNTRVIEIDSLTWWIPLPAADDPSLVEHALSGQDFPYRAMTQTRDVAVGGVMIDVGANTGRMSIPRVILGDVAIAYCAEPDPLNYLCLVRNIRDNGLRGLVLPDQLAIGAHDGTVRFKRARRAGGHKVVDAAAASEPGVIEVPSLTLDTWTERMGIDVNRVHFVKVDVQGSEVDVLRGAARVLSHKHIAWQIEVDLQLLAGRDLRGERLYSLMESHFSHFIDLSRHATGARVRRTSELGQALAYVSGGSAGRTDVLLFTLDPLPDA